MNNLSARLAASLGDNYRIERELGGGGMSRVFLATDTELGRQVVVKVLRPDGAHGVSVDRFRREIWLAARLQHPHIVPLLSAGEVDGLPYFTMPFIDGESLRSRLARADELSIAEVVRLLREVASALAYAHKKGTVHRDIKPENILLADAHAMVTDFGVAKALHAATTQEIENLTSAGMVLGTPAYMSPEQAVGDPSTNHRADVYALGLVAYEMLTGHGPFDGRAPQAMLAAHLTETPAHVTSKRSSCPPALAALVMRCLEKNPAHRPQVADEVLNALDDVPLVRTPPSTVRQRPSVAVLPMVNTSGDTDNEHFSDGLTDELIGALSKVRELSVTGRTSVFALKGQGLSVPAIAQTLGVMNVLEGSVRRAGERLKVSVQLVDRDGNILWSDAYDRTLTDVFAVQEDIAQAVVRALEIRLAGGRELSVRPPTQDIVAYEYFLKGRSACRWFTLDAYERGIAYLEQALRRDPEYAAALAWLSNAYVLRAVLRRPTREDIVRGRSCARQAVALDPKLADAHWVLGQALMCFDWDFAGADHALLTALALDPGHVDARNYHGMTLLHQGRFEESLSELEQAIAIDPLLPDAYATMGRTYLSMHRPDRAIGCFRKVLELTAGHPAARGHMGQALLQTGQYAEALAEFEMGAASSEPRNIALLAYGYAVAGQQTRAVETLRKILDDQNSQGVPPFHLGMAYAGLGDADQVFRWLERAAAELDPWFTSLNIEPAFDPLRSDARFGQLLRRLGFAPGSSIA
jgi:serine/threonine-protein kinase